MEDKMAKFWAENIWLMASDLVPGSLDDAIAKWEFLAEHPEVSKDSGGETCTLCLAAGPACFGCPILEHTEEIDCHGTAYFSWRYALSAKDRIYFANVMIELLREIRAEASGQMEVENV
jgi:hypothetical protein